ncbi:MAG: hypothetical protein MUE73_03215 [Planctomycetes bacterium]|jgi:hypothetical protein|nr:hypothetical protein [Planctomycetota bacterium]
MKRIPVPRKCLFSFWPPINPFQLIIAIVMLLLGLLGDRLGLSPEMKQMILGIAIALLITLSAAALPAPSVGGPQGAPPFTRFKLVNFADIPVGARTTVKNEDGVERPVPPGSTPPPPVPPGGQRQLQSVDPPFMENVVSVTTTVYRGPTQIATTFTQAPSLAGQFIAAQDLYAYKDPITGRYQVLSVLYCKVEEADPEYVQSEKTVDLN